MHDIFAYKYHFHIGKSVHAAHIHCALNICEECIFVTGRQAKSNTHSETEKHMHIICVHKHYTHTLHRKTWCKWPFAVSP